jgi:hypothetical protein
VARADEQRCAGTAGSGIRKDPAVRLQTVTRFVHVGEGNRIHRSSSSGLYLCSLIIWEESALCCSNKGASADPFPLSAFWEQYPDVIP